VAVLVSNWGGERLPQATATAMVGSRWRPGLTKALATANGGPAVLAGGEVAFVGSPVARLGRQGLQRIRGCMAKASRAQGEASGSQVAGRDVPAATVT